MCTGAASFCYACAPIGISFDLLPKPASNWLINNTRRAADAAVKAGAVTPELAGKLTDRWVTNAELKEAEAQLSQPQTPALAAATTALDEAQTSLRLAIANATRLEATGGKDLETLAELQAAKKSLRAAGEKLGPAIDALVARLAHSLPLSNTIGSVTLERAACLGKTTFRNVREISARRRC